MKGEGEMNGEELYELFVAHETGPGEIAGMELALMAAQVGEMRRDEPDEIDMTDLEIAWAVQDYAAGRN